MNGRLLAIAGEDRHHFVQESRNCGEAVCVSRQKVVHAPRERLDNEAVNVRKSKHCGGEDGDEGVNVDVRGPAGVFERQLG